MGLNNKVPIPALYADSEWSTSTRHRKIAQIRFWLRLFNTDNTRVVKKIFTWDYKRALMGSDCWNKDIKEILQEADMSDLFYGLEVEHKNKMMKKVKEATAELERNEILDNINGMPKLRTYAKIKLDTNKEPYLDIMNRKRRSLIAQTRCGTLPINIEIGRHKNLKINERTCPRCPEKTEDEEHFLTECPLYEKEHKTLFTDLHNKTNIETEQTEKTELLYLLLNINIMVNKTAHFIEEALEKRRIYIKDSNKRKINSSKTNS